MLYDYVEDLSHHLFRLFVASFDVFGSDSIVCLQTCLCLSLLIAVCHSSVVISGILIITLVLLLCTSMLLPFSFSPISCSVCSCSLSSFNFVEFTPQTLLFLLADLISWDVPDPFEVFECSLNFSLSFCCLVPDAFFICLLNCFNRCFSPLDVLLLSSTNLLISTSSFEITSLDSRVFFAAAASFGFFSLVFHRDLFFVTNGSTHTVSLLFLVHVVPDMQHDRTCLLVRLCAMSKRFFICFSYRLTSLFTSISKNYPPASFASASHFLLALLLFFVSSVFLCFDSIPCLQLQLFL